MIRSPAFIKIMTVSVLFGFGAAIAPLAVSRGAAFRLAARSADRSRTHAAAVELHARRRESQASDHALRLSGPDRRSCSSFLGNDCPVGNLYVPRLIELEREFRKKGVVFIGINSNAHETAAEVAKFVADRGIEFSVVKDPENKVADAALIERTCEVIVLDGFARIRYRGAIDDQYQQGKGKDGPDHTYLRDALTAIVANQPVKVTSTKVAGCLLDRVAVKAC